MTEGDVDAHYDAQRRELDRLTILNLVASAEGTVKVDYFRRVDEKLKDALSLAYRQWHKTLSAKKQLRPDFDDGGSRPARPGRRVRSRQRATAGDSSAMTGWP